MGFKEKRQPSTPVPTSSMGDIAFLLIIFFMLTSKFMQESHVTYEKARSPDVKPVEDSSISVIVDQDGQIWLQGQICATPEMMRSGVEVLRADRKDAVVMLKIHKDLTQKMYGQVVSNLGQAGVKVSFIGDRSADYAR